MQPLESTDQPVLRIEIKHTDPVDAVSFAEFLVGLSNSYQRYARGAVRQESRASGLPSLSIAQVERGSIVISLIAVYPFALQVIEKVNTLVEFAKLLRDVFMTLSSQKGVRQLPGRITLKDAGKIVGPIAKDSASQLNIGVVQGDVNLTYVLTSEQAREIQNSARELQVTPRRISEKFNVQHLEAVQDLAPRKVREAQLRFSSVGTTESKQPCVGAIKSEGNTPSIVNFANARLEATIAEAVNLNPLRCTYIVDVTVESDGDGTHRYRIDKLHKVIPNK
jgi:hypothetical protein